MTTEQIWSEVQVWKFSRNCELKSMKLTLWRVAVVLKTHTKFLGTDDERVDFSKLRMCIKDNSNSPQGKFH